MTRLALLLIFFATACARDVPVERDSSVSATPGSSAVALPEDSVTLTVRDYYAAIQQHDLARAGSMREDSAAFIAAHGGSDIRNVEIGAPGPIEGAAGSRFVTVPVTFDDSVAGRPSRRLHEVVTLRKAVVDGATAAQRRWRIYQIQGSDRP